MSARTCDFNLEELINHLNSTHRKIKCTVELEVDRKLPFLDVLIIREPNGRLSHTVYRKPTHTDRYLGADSHHHPSHLSSVPRALINRSLSLCDPKYIDSEMNHLRHILQRNGYLWHQCTRMINATGHMKNSPVGMDRTPAYLPFIRGVTKKDKDPLDVPGVYTIPCDCGLSYVGETRRNIATRLKEHIQCMKSMDSNRSAVAEHACITDTAHCIRFDEAAVLAREKHFIPRKVREAIEISRHSNFNRDSGWTLPPAWRPALKLKKHECVPSLECDTVSIICTQKFYDEDDTPTSIDDLTDAPASHPSPTRTPSSLQSSARAQRQAQRWARSADSATNVAVEVARSRAHD